MSTEELASRLAEMATAARIARNGAWMARNIDGPGSTSGRLIDEAVRQMDSVREIANEIIESMQEGSFK